jgi:phosphoglycerate dehydrogenase-like enzyme
MDYIEKKLVGKNGDTIDPLLEESDFIILTVALTDDTFHMISKDTLKKVKPGAFLVNMARGGLVCTEDLIVALESGTLSGAGLDVFEEQPLSPDSVLWHMPNVYITPHSTPQVPDRQAATIEIIRENARRFEAGEPLLNLMKPSDAVSGQKAEGGWARMMNSGLSKEQIAKMPLEKFLGKRGWSDPSEWM